MSGCDGSFGLSDMSEYLTKPEGTPNDIIYRRGTHVGRMREEQPAVGQPTQDTIPGPGSADSE